MINREMVRNQLQAYLNHQITLEKLVDWAENAMFEAEFEQSDTELLSNVIGKIGVADVEGFELSWEDISDILSTLGYRVDVAVKTA